jgi:hypothetical protein
MRSFVTWATASTFRLVLLTVFCAQLLAPVAAALLVVDAARRGPMAATQSALLAILGVVLIGLALPTDLADSLSLILPILLGGLLGGILLSWSRSLSLAFQGTLIGALISTVLVFAVVPIESVHSEFLRILAISGASEVQVAAIATLQPIEIVWVLLTSLLIVIVATLMLGYWWYALLDEHVHFGADFRALKLGRVAGFALIVLLVLALFLDAGMIQTVAPIAVIGFLFQGLAVLHARSYSDKWPRAVIVIVYLLFIPWAPIAVMALSAVGLFDNFFQLRARGRPVE